jgi:hypothetical protein
MECIQLVTDMIKLWALIRNDNEYPIFVKGGEKPVSFCGTVYGHSSFFISSLR